MTIYSTKIQILTSNTSTSESCIDLNEKHHDTRSICDLRWFKKFKRFCRVLLVDGCNFRLKIVAESFKHVDKHSTNSIHYLVVMVVECHFHVQANKLGEMSVCVRVFRSED